MGRARTRGVKEGVWLGWRWMGGVLLKVGKALGVIVTTW
jgi:hypothetical protein